MNATDSKTYEYIFVINGVLPEFMPYVAYRRADKSVLSERKVVKCPHCKEVFFDIDRHTTVRIFRKRSGSNKKPKPIPGQIFKRCNACNNEIGLVMNVKGIAV